jgi:hypothetical protein
MNDEEQFLIYLGTQKANELAYWKGAVESLLVKAQRDEKKVGLV